MKNDEIYHFKDSDGALWQAVVLPYSEWFLCEDPSHIYGDPTPAVWELATEDSDGRYYKYLCQEHAEEFTGIREGKEN